jgi:hypothetical protein
MHWRVVPGEFEIMVGKSSADILLQGILKVTPERDTLSPRERASRTFAGGHFFA